MTGYFTHKDCWMHDMGVGHPECADRLDAIEDRLLISGLGLAISRHEAPLAKLEDITLAHSQQHVAAIWQMHESLQQKAAAGCAECAHLDPDTAMNPHTWNAALRAVGAVVAATDAVMTQALNNAFCAVRPPGHHACRDQAMGFCIFNNVAIAAKYALARHGLARVAIVDFDVHHGNGTEDIVDNDPRILMVGFFQHPFYPLHWPRSNASNLLNLPVPAYTRGGAVRELIQTTWLPRLEAFAPELILISAGFDAHREDDLGQLSLVEEDYAWITRQIRQVAVRHAQGRIVSCLEGGYNLNALARSVEAHIRELADV
jgi:acetoin utilization deacetylase AcuC-like enzyme